MSGIDFTLFFSSIVSDRPNTSCSATGVVFRSAFALGSNLEREVLFLSFTCKIFLYLGYLISISLGTVGLCNLSWVFFDGACHFWGLRWKSEYGQVSLLSWHTQSNNLFGTSTGSKKTYNFIYMHHFLL